MQNIYGAKQLAASFRTVRQNTIQVAEDIPEEKYSFTGLRLLAAVPSRPTEPLQGRSPTSQPRVSTSAPIAPLLFSIDSHNKFLQPSDFGLLEGILSNQARKLSPCGLMGVRERETWLFRMCCKAGGPVC